MFHRGPLCFATAALFTLSSPVFATQYDISTRADEIKADGFCSLREAVEAVNTQLGYIGAVRSDERGVFLDPDVVSEPRLTLTKEVRNVSRSGSFSVAGTRIVANRGDVLEYRIIIEAEPDSGNVENVSLAFLFPDQDPLVVDPDTGTWRGYTSFYIAGSTKLNGADVADVNGFPLATPLPVKDPKVGETDPTNVDGTIREGRQAEVVFRVRVDEGPDEAGVFSEDLIAASGGLSDEIETGEDRDYLVEAECAAGTLSNSINLKSVTIESGNDPVQYQLTQGPLVIDAVSGSVAVTFQAMRDDAFDREEKLNVELVAQANQRIFEVDGNATLNLAGITLIGNGALAASEFGGLIHAAGSLDLREGTLLRDGQADSGGAIYVEGTQNLVFQETRFENNTATAGNGGAIAAASGFRGAISGTRFYFEGNVASGDGGAIHLDGVTPALFLQNGTFYNNTAVNGGAIRVQTDGRISSLNNVSIAGNTTTAGVVGTTGALSYRTPSSTGLFDELINSALVGNAGGDCAADDGPATPGDNSTLDLADIAYVVSAGATPDAPSCGPLDAEFLSEATGEPFDYSLVDFGLLIGRDPVDLASDDRYACDAAAAPGSCRPIVFDDELKGFLPNNAPVYAGAPAAGRIVPSVVSAGSPEDAVSFVCQPKDQRDQNREPRCDAGAVELQIAAGSNDEFRVVQGEAALLDVLANDLGDLTVDCRTLVDPLACIGFFLPPRQTDLQPLNWISGVTSAANPDAGTELVVVDDREGVYLDRDPVQKTNEDGTPMVDEFDQPVFEDTVIFPDGYPLVLHTPLPDFHGVDQFRYFLDQAAVAGPVYAGANPSANTNLVVEPADGLKSTSSIGAFGWPFLMVFGLLFARRRQALSVLLFALAMNAQAADIIVNTNLDSAQPQDGVFDRDGLCSLREALLVSIDRSPFFFPDCAPGATGRDRIILDIENTGGTEGTIELLTTLEISNSAVDIEGRGPGATIIQPAAGNQQRLFFTSSSLTFRNLTLAGGYSPDNGGAIFTTGNLVLENVELRDNQALGSGGAIYLSYNSEQKRQFTARRAYIHNNTAGLNGGVLSMVAQNEKHDLFFDAVTFEGNTAPAGAGGALDVNLPQGGGLRILNSTFVDNDAMQGGAVDMQQMAATTTAYIVNSTFMDNATIAAGAIEAGNSSGRIFMSNSIYVGSGECNSGTVKLEESYYNLFESPRPVSCEGNVGDVGNMETAGADIRQVLNGGTLAGEEFISGRYIPPHLLILSQAAENPLAYPAGVFIIDAGNDTLELVSNDSAPRACRALDLRGTSRESGGRCDLGAYELQVPTAIDDAVSNKFSLSRSMRFDVLFNDLIGDGVPDGSGGTIDNTTLTGTIDLDPVAPNVNASNTVTVAADSGNVDIQISKVENGRWTIDNSAEELDEGVYELVAVLRNGAGNFIANARQTVIVRNPADPDDEDTFVVTGSSALNISGVRGPDDLVTYADEDFIVSDGRLIVSGLTDVEAELTDEDLPTVELFINDLSVGETDVELGDPADGCGGDVGSANELDNCIVRVEPQSPLTCEDVAGDGLEVVFPYSFHVTNSQSNIDTESTVAEITATITNVAPRLQGEVRHSRPGKVETFRLDLTDPDYSGAVLPLFDTDPGPVNANTKSLLKLRTAPSFAATVIRELNIDGPEVLQLVYGIEGYGVIDPASEVYAPGTDGLGLLVRQVEPGIFDVIYTPRDNEGQFNDRFVLGYEDECGAVATAEFKIVYPEANSLAGSYGSAGLIALLALLGRRRQRRR